METNDDELDKLIQETQSIWKSLKNSGVEINDVSHTNETKFAKDNEIVQQNDNKVTEELDRMAIRLNNHSFNFDSDQKSGKKSRTLQGLNLASPPNTFNSFVLSDEASRLSNIRFSTPSNYTKKCVVITSPFFTSNKKTEQNLSSVIPDTPTLFSPSLHLSNTKTFDTNLTLSAKNNEKNNAVRRQTETIDFSDESWDEINRLLSRCGFTTFGIMVNDNSQAAIREKLKEILVKYEELLSTESSHLQQNQALLDRERELKTLQMQNEELKQQIHISSEKINDLKNELREQQQQNQQNDERNNHSLIDIKRQLEHSKGIISKRNEEIDKLKEKLNETIEKDAIRRESVEAVFQSIHKRNAKRNNKKDQKQLDIMEMYESERKKMQKELKQLRKEMKNLSEKMVEQQTNDHNDTDDDDDDSNYVRKKRRNAVDNNRFGNVSYTPSAKRQSDGDNDSDSDEEVIADMKWKSSKTAIERTNHVNLKEIERIKKLMVLEAQNLRTKLDDLGKEKTSLESQVADLKQENLSLTAELEKRPSFNEWNRLRSELKTLSKKLLETKKVASLRKYMDTRELIKRDKEIHQLQLLQINDIPKQILCEILQDLCRTLKVKDVTILVPNVSKIARCIESVPILEQYITKIVRVLINSEHAPQLVKLSKIAPKDVFNSVVPVINEWITKLDTLSTLTTFREKVHGLLQKRSIYKKSNETVSVSQSKDSINAEMAMLPLHEMVQQIEELVQSEEYLLKSKQSFAEISAEMNQKPNELTNRILTHFQHLFSVSNIEGIFPKMNQIYLENNEQRNLIKSIKSMLGLQQNCATNLCFKQIQKMVNENKNCHNSDGEKKGENNQQTMAMFKKWNELMSEIRDCLQCENETNEEIVEHIKELTERCKEYDAVFPRVHNLVNQLRDTLSVEYAHQILPKVKQLVEMQTAS